jgi:hypothetical protein
VIDDALHDKAKKKGKPGQKLACVTLLIKLGLAASVIVILGYCGWLTIVGWPYFFRPSTFSAQDVAETCILLKLPADSAFCSVSGEPIIEALDILKMDLEKLYPLGSTISDLKKHFGFGFCGSGSCSKSLPLPWVHLYVEYNEPNQVIGYLFTDEEGNVYRKRD